jgi:hypothetical protein
MVDSLLDVVLLVLVLVVVLGYPALLWWVGHGRVLPIDRPIRAAPRRATQRLQRALGGWNPLRLSSWRRLIAAFTP